MSTEEIVTLETAFPEEDPEADPVTLAAQKAFNIKYLYPWQRLVIANILDDLDDRDEPEEQKQAGSSPEKDDSLTIPAAIKQIVLLPTGAGKSMCFLVPAILFKGPTLILYPLLALMSDQARRMTEGGITHVVFRGGQTEEERAKNFAAIKNGAKIILANPEVLQSDTLVSQLAACGISHIAIDEAHCVSEWGDSFRPAYLTLGDIIDRLKVPRVTAFTATASPTVLARVNEVLFKGAGHIVRSEADRPNIHYYVHYASAKEKAVLALAEQEEKPLIVFCGTRSRTEMMAHMLREQQQHLHPGLNDSVRFYHAGLSREEKDDTERWFYPKTDAILVCTCAFGMGVDKKDIRTVIHLDVPATAEAFIQEAGRGGRDGSIAKSFLVWSSEDSSKAAGAGAGPRARVMPDFAESTTCRRQVLLDALGGEQAACRGCDICQGVAENEAQDETDVLGFLKRHAGQFTAEEAAAELALSGSHRRKKAVSMNRQAPAASLDRGDYLAIINALINGNKVRKGKYVWKNRLFVTANNRFRILLTERLHPQMQGQLHQLQEFPQPEQQEQQ